MNNKLKCNCTCGCFNSEAGMEGNEADGAYTLATTEHLPTNNNFLYVTNNSNNQQNQFPALPSVTSNEQILPALSGNFATPKHRNPTKGVNSSSPYPMVKRNLLGEMNSQNRFAIFNDLEFNVLRDPKVIAPAENTEEKSTENLNANKHSKATSQQRAAKQQKVAEYCQPIFLFNIDVKNLIDQLKLKYPQVEFKVINKSKYKSKLLIKDLDIYLQMMAQLKAKKVDSYSMTPKQLKVASVILRGLHYNMSADEIKQELDEICPSTVASVNKFVTNYSKKKGVDTGLFLVTLNQGFELKDIAKIKTIAYQMVTWEKPKVNANTIQCRNCQQWGHAAKNCNRAFRCMKCNENHEAGACMIQKDDGSQAFCVNCNTFGHPANWRGCPAFKRYSEFKNKNNNLSNNINLKAQNNVHSALNNHYFVSKGKSFASQFYNVDSNNRYTQLPNMRKPKLIEDFLAVAKRILEPVTVTIEDRIQNFLDNCNYLSKDELRDQCCQLLSEVRTKYGF
uniref:Nucleic-acid-binding protein from transposon X-element n=1 Tax=Bactrocera latifrons TaxID=174628 RepID=A0A0K8V3M5_BACLA